MKKYIKPSIKMIEVKSKALLCQSNGWEEIPINDGFRLSAKFKATV